MIKFNDRSNILLDDVKTTPDGYKVIRSKVARTGVQSYRGAELGDTAVKAGFGRNDVVRLYRDPKEVFSADAVNGWAGVPVTIDHPQDLVTPETVKSLSVGDVRDKAHIDAANGWLGLEWIIRDADALNKFNSGVYGEVSGGYTADIDFTAGVSPEGQPYDARQVNIKPNHLAMVPKGRAFSDSAWGASPVQVEDTKMTVDLKAIAFGDSAVQVEAKFADALTTALKDHKAAIEAKDAALAVKDAEIADLKGKILTDADIEALIEEKGKKKKKREEVEAKIGDKAKSFTDEQVDVAHAMLDAIPNDKARVVIGDRQHQIADGASAWDVVYGKGK